jgi:hypothetical protein
VAPLTLKGRSGRVRTAIVRVLALVALLWLQHPHAAAAQDPSSEEAVAERRVKAAYLYRFAGYTEWPDDVFARPDSPLVIGVWGNDELADDLAKLVASRTVAGRHCEVRKVRDAEGLAGVHLLFVARDRTVRAAEVLAASPLRGVLVVTDSPGALRHGGAVNFLALEGQIRFELSLEAAERRGLKLSSRLAAVSSNLAGKVR